MPCILCPRHLREHCARKPASLVVSTPAALLVQHQGNVEGSLPVLVELEGDVDVEVLQDDAVLVCFGARRAPLRAALQIVPAHPRERVYIRQTDNQSAIHKTRRSGSHSCLL